MKQTYDLLVLDADPNDTIAYLMTVVNIVSIVPYADYHVGDKMRFSPSGLTIKRVDDNGQLVTWRYRHRFDDEKLLETKQPFSGFVKLRFCNVPAPNRNLIGRTAITAAIAVGIDSIIAVILFHSMGGITAPDSWTTVVIILPQCGCSGRHHRSRPVQDHNLCGSAHFSIL